MKRLKKVEAGRESQIPSNTRNGHMSGELPVGIGIFTLHLSDGVTDVKHGKYILYPERMHSSEEIPEVPEKQVQQEQSSGHSTVYGKLNYGLVSKGR